MKVTLKLLYGLILTVLISTPLNAQGLTIGSETTFSLGQSTLYLPNNWNNSGTFVAGFGTVVFNGGNGNQTIKSSGEETFSFLTVNKPSGDLQLLNNMTVNGDLDIISGDLDGNNNIVTLGGGLNGRSGGPIYETPGNTFKGGIITTIVPFLNAPDSFSTMGVAITSTEDLGSTLISRGHFFESDSNLVSILRSFNIAPSNNNNLNATLVFRYDESELNGLSEKDLALYLIPDSGPGWIKIGGIVDTQANTVTASGIDQFNLMTLASSNAPIPVELVSFTAVSKNNSVKLSWQTATELNNRGFEIERRSQESGDRNQNNPGWTKVGFVEGFGTTTEVHSYSFTDENTIGGSKFKYRLKQIDIDGSYKYSDEVEVDITPDNFHLSQNYPNPFNPTTKFKFSLPSEGVEVRSTMVTLKVYDILGNEVATLVNEEKPAGVYEVSFDASDLSSGIYFYRLQAGAFIETRKMIFIK